MNGIVEKAVNAIIRPPRSNYDLTSLPLFLDSGDDKLYIRYPISFVNKRKQKIIGSIYHSKEFSPLNGGPCVVYLHGNASSQLEGQFLVPNLCPYGLFVFCFDFIGCGCSDGDYVSLGYFETQDTEYLLNILENQFKMGPFILWGRSMGAATTILTQHHSIIGKISDSSFTSINDMCSSIAKTMSLPSIFVPSVIWFLKRQVLSTANFDIDEITPFNSLKNNNVPAVFGHAEDDQFIPFDQCLLLYQNYPNPQKFLMTLEGGHNGKRNIDWLQLGITFIFNLYNIEIKNLVISEARKLQSSNFHFISFNEMLNNNNNIDVSLNEFIENEKLENEKLEKEKRRERRRLKHLENERKREKKRDRKSVV